MKIPPHGTADRIQWDRGEGAGMQSVLYSDVNGNPGSGQHPLRMQEAVQAAIDWFMSFADMLADPEWQDEELLILNPDTEGVFHGDAAGKKVAVSTHLVVRSYIIEPLTLDGAQYNFRVRKAR